MSELFIYLIKANIALVLFYLGYRFFLRNLTFYRVNRYYLLFAFIFSSTYPLINWVELFKNKTEIPKQILSILPNWQQFEVANKGVQWYQIVEVFFWISAAVFIIGLLIKLSGILRIHSNSVPSQWTVYPYRKSKEDIVPFSFWKNIYLNPSKHKEIELDKIFKHEYVHVCQLHSLDILIAETALTFFWYNPICWLLRKDIRENIEFITDQNVLSQGVDKQSYQYSLLNIGSSSNQPILGNHFNIKNLKKRIMMMNKKRNSNMHLSKYIFIIPVVIIGSLIFGITKAKENKAISTFISEKLNVDLPSIEQDTTNKKTKTKITLKATPSDNKELINKNDSVDTSEEKIRIKDDQNKGKIEEEEKLSPLIDTLDNGALNLTKLGDYGKGAKIVYIRKDSTKSQKIPLYIVDGKMVSASTFNHLDASNILSLEVLKGQEAVTLYGYQGKNGIIIATTKSKDTSKVVGSQEIPESVIIYVDGAKSDKKTVDSLIKSGKIKSMNIMKDKESIDRYGEEGKEGVIEITTKDSVKK